MKIQVDTKIILGIISICLVFTNEAEVMVWMWVFYGIYKVITS